MMMMKLFAAAAAAPSAHLVWAIVVVLVRDLKPGTEDWGGAVDQHLQLLLWALRLVAAVTGWQYRRQYRKQYRWQYMW